MKDKFLFWLKVTYVFVVGMMFLSAVVSFHSKIRAILLLIAFISIAVIHIIISLNIHASKTNKKFFFLSFLWCIKFVIFIINELLNFLLQEKMLILDWIDLFLLLVIALLISVSFLIKIPFWYMKTENRISVVGGILAMIFSGWIILQVIFSLIDYIKERGSSLYFYSF